MNPNPEFRRNLWLELTSHRLVAAPLILMLIVAVATSIDDDNRQNPGAFAAMAIYLAVTLLWGGRQTYDAIVDEVRERTWDTQRMSALSAGTMLVGKLLGSTAFHWYVGIPALAAFAVLFDGDRLDLAPPWSTARITLIALFSALLLQGGGLLAGLMAIKSGRGIKNSRSLTVTLAGVVGLLGLTALLASQAAVPVYWLDRAWPKPDFLLGSMMAFTGWMWLGCWRLMSEQLAVRLLPWGSTAFAVFLTLYLGAFIPAVAWSFPAKFFTFGTLIGTTMVYVGAWKERRDWIAIRRLIRTWQFDPPVRALQATPDWIVLAAFSALCAVSTAAEPLQSQAIGQLPAWVTELARLSPLTLILTMLRDIGLLYFFSLGARSDRANSTTLFYLAMLYFLLPALMGESALLADPLLSPMAQEDFWLGPVIAACHLGIVAFLLSRRLRQTRASMASQPG